MRIHIVLALSSCLLPIANDLAAQSHQQPMAETKHSEIAQVEFAKEVEKLIDQLASKYPKPDKRSDSRPPREAGIWDAVDKLHSYGTAAFPYLIAHFDDERFSFSEESPATTRVYHESVGRLCWEIVERQVKKCSLWKVPDPRGTPGFTGKAIVPRDKEEARSWWKTNQEKRLWQLQADSVRVILEENRERLAREDDADRRRHCSDAIQANEQLLSRLLQSELPIPTKPFRPYVSR